MRSLFLFLISVPYFAMAQAKDKVSPDILSLESGVICAPPTEGEAAAPNTIAGTTHLISDVPPFVSTINRVPAVLGIGFGVKSVSVAPEGITGIDMVITHPPMGTSRVTEQSYATSIRGDSQSITFYQFDYDYELLPGDWTMEAHHKGKILFTTSFLVLPPSKLPDLASICGFEELLSHNVVGSN